MQNVSDDSLGLIRLSARYTCSINPTNSIFGNKEIKKVEIRVCVKKRFEILLHKMFRIDTFKKQQQ